MLFATVLRSVGLIKEAMGRVEKYGRLAVRLIQSDSSVEDKGEGEISSLS